MVPIPDGGVRIDFGTSEVSSKRLDLTLILRQLEVHLDRKLARQPVILALVSRSLSLILLVVALSGCGSEARAPSPSSVVRAWSDALNAGDNQRAADLFAPDAQVVQGNLVRRLHTHSQAAAFNRALPCSGRIVELQARGRDIEATFVLGNRPASQCDGPGERAAALFRVRRGKIVLWHQIPVPPTEPVV